IPSGYDIQTMTSNLHLNSFLLPIGAMNVISILPLLLLAPLMECVTSCYLSMEKTPFSPAMLGHACAALSVLVAGLSEVHRKGYPLTEQALSGKVLQVSSMACFQLAPHHIRGISLHFLPLSYRGGCFLGALIIQLVYLLSGGNFYPNTLHEGNLEHCFLFLAMLMTINTL
ncbi:unnamed protein product, partial [Coregonus sp. 'balchen']